MLNVKSAVAYLSHFGLKEVQIYLQPRELRLGIERRKSLFFIQPKRIAPKSRALTQWVISVIISIKKSRLIFEQKQIYYFLSGDNKDKIL
jgi:hypothetical protein